MCEAAADALSFGESSSRVRAILITGGPGIFTAGHDAAELAGFAEEGAIGESVVRLLKTLATVDKPVVAAVDGPVFGFGTTLLFLCDYVVASEWSSFAAPFVDIGLPPDAGVEPARAAADRLPPRLRADRDGRAVRRARRRARRASSTASSGRGGRERRPARSRRRSPPSRRRRSGWRGG